MTRYTNTGRKRTYLEAGFREKYASESPEPEVEEPQTKRKRGDKKVKREKGNVFYNMYLDKLLTRVYNRRIGSQTIFRIT